MGKYFWKTHAENDTQFNKGLSHYYESFDIVHSRSTANGMKDFDWFIMEAAQCLKPGGMLLIAEGSTELLDHNKQIQKMAFGQGGPGESWMARSLFECYNTMKRRGSSIDACTRQYEVMHACSLLTDVGTKVTLVPVGPWERGSTPEETRQKEIMGVLMRSVFTELVRSLRPLFISEGYPPALVEQFIEESGKELSELRLHMYAKWYYAWATRITHGNDGSSSSG
ncbi:hypothetical protein BD410DRAFT_903020 [Rickenella mellea]|uniref:Methyltransferase type 11 domain-containing protein n=1 Tax=Rickenella mellea TaxID=50990 RepID=A0A4Y7PHQ6_9AGAM|nr:hypothetical protein BD410DRAFT_903020 [Rickenella mellea]